jgi:hypothetical protein
MVEFYLGECKKKNFMPLNKQKNTMFLKEPFKRYKRIDEKKVLHNYFELIYEEYVALGDGCKHDKRTMDSISVRCAERLGAIMRSFNSEKIGTFDKETNIAAIYFKA